MNKILLSFLVAAATVSGADARSLSPSEALRRAVGANAPSRSIGASLKTMPSLTLTENGAPMVYVFESNGDTGYMIVSADDVAAPVLGYSDNGKFDAENMPENLRWWLGQYKGEIAGAVNSGVAAYSAPSRAGKAAIAPLTTTRWNQDAPYNLKCPLVAGSETMTGCVATAFAQVLKYHNWPEKGTGTHSYTWNNQTLSFDFGATTFQWDLMLDTYTPTATSNQTNAVATLMYACGVSVDMEYSSKESGAITCMVVPALIDYFNYDKGARIALRNYHTSSDWDDMVYTELSTNGPVLYAGQSSEGGGHAFVCDGYRDGYYHFNWGWGGMSDGYFLLNALDPGSQGIGGSTSAFNFDQQIVLGVKKPVASSTYADPYIVCYDKLAVQQSDGYLYLVGPFYNFSSRTVKGKFVLDLINESGSVKSLDYSNELDLAVGAGRGALGLSPSSFPEGTYKGYLMFETEGKKYPVQIFKSQLGYIDIKKASNKLTASVPDNGTLSVSDLALTSELYIDSPFKYTATVKTTSDDGANVGIVPLLLKSENVKDICAVGYKTNVDIPANGTISIEELTSWDEESIKGKLVVGDYYFCLATNAGYELSGDKMVEAYNVISPLLPVRLKSNLMPPSLKVNSWFIQDPSAVDPYNLVAKVSVTNGFGYYANPIGLYIFPKVEGGGSVSSVAYALSEPLFLNSGESKEITITCDLANQISGLQVGGKYFAALRDMLKNDWFDGQIAFTIGQSGIEDIVEATEIGATVSPNPAVDYAAITAPEDITGVQIVSMSGAVVTPSVEVDGNVASVDVSSLPTGIYVARVTTVSSVYTVKVVKR